MIEINGHVEEGWGAVADVFGSHFEQDLERGAACAVSVGGRPVVDVWAGVADSRSGRPWREDTVSVALSVTKGATALCAAILVDRGLLDLDAPVARYWPEFAAAGKQQIPVRWVMSHRAGLSAVDAELTIDEICAWEPMVRALERQAPCWEPGTAYGYHAWTYGFLVGELVRRIAGMNAGRFFAEEVAKPLGLNAWIGLPEEIEPRVAYLETRPPSAELLASMQHLDPASVGVRALTLNGAIPQLASEDGGLNTRQMRAAELPAANMVTDARSVARMYAAMVGDVDGHRLLSPETVGTMSAIQTAGVPRHDWPEAMADVPEQPFAVGYMTQSMLLPMLGPRSFGHTGAGGSFGFADPDREVGFGYVMNLMNPGFIDARPNAIVEAISGIVRG
jgi:CubicO group peptidase (beta-lactamase class C family)